jgi:hypothetical protein
MAKPYPHADALILQALMSDPPQYEVVAGRLENRTVPDVERERAQRRLRILRPRIRGLISKLKEHAADVTVEPDGQYSDRNTLTSPVGVSAELRGAREDRQSSRGEAASWRTTEGRATEQSDRRVDERTRFDCQGCV